MSSFTAAAVASPRRSLQLQSVPFYGDKERSSSSSSPLQSFRSIAAAASQSVSHSAHCAYHYTQWNLIESANLSSLELYRGGKQQQPEKNTFRGVAHLFSRRRWCRTMIAHFRTTFVCSASSSSSSVRSSRYLSRGTPLAAQFLRDTFFASEREELTSARRGARLFRRPRHRSLSSFSLRPRLASEAAALLLPARKRQTTAVGTPRAVSLHQMNKDKEEKPETRCLSRIMDISGHDVAFLQDYLFSILLSSARCRLLEQVSPSLQYVAICFGTHICGRRGQLAPISA